MIKKIFQQKQKYNIYIIYMCYNLETSIVSFTFAMASGIAALSLKQYVLGLLILCYGQMQLSEVFIWKGITDNNVSLNIFGTAYGKYLLPAHNLAIGLGIYLHTKNILPLIIGALFYLIVMLIYARDKAADITKVGCGANCNKLFGKLQWPYEHGWYLMSFIISLLLLILYIKPYYSQLLFLFVFSLTFAMIYLLDYNKAVGSFWCWSTAILAPVFVLANTYIIKKYGGKNVIS